MFEKEDFAQAQTAQAQHARRMVEGAVAARPANFAALKNLLESQVERAHAIGSLVESLAAAVFGPVPTAQGVGIEEAPPPTLAGLIDQLDSALTRIESGLNRL